MSYLSLLKVKKITRSHNMWQVLVFKMVMAGLRSLAKSSQNTIDDEIIKVVDDAVILKTIKSLI